MTRAADLAAQLTRAIDELAQQARCPIDIAHVARAGWCSATFVGERHRFTVSGTPGPVIDDWMVGLSEADFVLPGHLVADVDIIAVRHAPARIEIDLEILTVESA